MHPTGNTGVFLNQCNGDISVQLLPPTNRTSRANVPFTAGETRDSVRPPPNHHHGAYPPANHNNGGLLRIASNLPTTTARPGVYNNATHTVTDSYHHTDHRYTNHPPGYQNGYTTQQNGMASYGTLNGMQGRSQYNATIVQGTQASTPSLFDMIAKSQYNNSKIRRGSGGRRGSLVAGRRGSNVGFAGTLSVLTKSLSKNKVSRRWR